MVGFCVWIGYGPVSPGETTAKPAPSLPPLTLQQISALDQKTFEHSLRQLQQAMEQPRPSAGTNRETLAALAGKLRLTRESTPDYWSTVLRFIPFASSLLAQSAPPPGQPPRVLSEILSRGLMRGIREKGITMLFDDGDLGNGEFTNCRIMFTPNPVQLTHAVFRNCVFELPTADPPNDYIKKVSRILLRSNLSSVSIPTL
jgi:hypothetical protein